MGKVKPAVEGTKFGKLAGKFGRLALKPEKPKLGLNALPKGKKGGAWPKPFGVGKLEPFEVGEHTGATQGRKKRGRKKRK